MNYKKRNSGRAGEMGQSVRYLVYGHEDLS